MKYSYFKYDISRKKKFSMDVNEKKILNELLLLYSTWIFFFSIFLYENLNAETSHGKIVM